MSKSYIERYLKEPSTSYFLFGPRGTGKSTMASQRNPTALCIDLRVPELRYRLTATPSLLQELVQAQPDGQTIVIDEIQKVPTLLSIVHKLIEEKRNWKFILTGSSARKLKQQAVDLLGGRALKKVLHPFMASELKELFNLENALLYGLLPIRFQEVNPVEFLHAYISLYLEEEVKSEGLIRRLDPFARFLQALSFSHGAIINISNVAKDCAVSRTTVHEWLSIIEDLLICYQLPVFNQRAKRQVTSHPKFYFFDVGVYRSIRPHMIKDPLTEMEGPALEGLVMQHLIAWCDYTGYKHTLHFWRTKSGVEVDFIVHGPLGFWAIEVKNSKHVRPKDIRALCAFSEDYPDAKTLLLYRGNEKLVKQGVVCMPCDEFLKNLTPDQMLL